MLAALPLVALLGQVAKVDIRAGGTLTSDAVLAGMLKAAYAGAGLDVPTEHMTVMHAAMVGAYVIEVDAATPEVRAQLDAYWCQNDPALRNGFKDLVVVGTGLTDVTEVRTCVGASGEPCESSTPCGGGGDGGGSGGDDGTEEQPAPEPAPEPAPDNGGGDAKKDDGNDGLSAVAIVFIVLGTLFVLGFLTYLLWPWLQTCWVPDTAHAEPIMTPVTPTPSGLALPTLSNVA